MFFHKFFSTKLAQKAAAKKKGKAGESGQDEDGDEEDDPAGESAKAEEEDEEQDIAAAEDEDESEEEDSDASDVDESETRSAPHDLGDEPAGSGDDTDPEEDEIWQVCVPLQENFQVVAKRRVWILRAQFRCLHPPEPARPQLAFDNDLCPVMCH